MREKSPSLKGLT